jgi:hypothetical protein
VALVTSATLACAPAPQPQPAALRLGTAVITDAAFAPVFEVPAPWTQMDVGWLEVTAQDQVAVTGTIEVDVGVDERVVVVMVGSPAAVVGVHDVLGPTGLVLDPSDNDAGVFERALSRGFVGAWRSEGRSVVGDEQAMMVWPVAWSAFRWCTRSSMTVVPQPPRWNPCGCRCGDDHHRHPRSGCRFRCISPQPATRCHRG